MSEITLSDDGFPVLMADVPNAGTSTVDANAKSGNPRHDKASGKFGSGGGGKQGPSQAQANFDPTELALRRDALRDAARQSDAMTAEDATQFLKSRVRDMTKVDMDQFLRGIREQRLDDLADLLAIDMGAKKSLKVKISATRGYTKKVFSGLSDDEVLHMAVRMTRRGFSEDTIQRSFLNRIKEPERRQALTDRYGDAVAAYKKGGK